MAIIQEPWGKREQLRHAAVCSWPKMVGRRTQHLRLCQDLELLGYNGMVASLSADDIVSGWIESGWVVRSPNGIELRVTEAGEEQLKKWSEEDRLWDEGGANAIPKKPVGPVGAKTEAEILAHVTGLLKDDYRYRDVRNAAVSTWRRVIDQKGGKAPQWDFINSINLLVMKEPGRVLEPVEILTEWQKSGWVEYSPDGSELRITPSGVGKLGEWEEENKLWRSGQNKQPPQDGTTTGKEPTALVQSLLGDLSKLPSGDSIKLDALRKRGRLIIAKVFGNASRYLTDLESIKFHAATYQQAVKPEMARGSWDRGREKFKNLCNTMLEDINLPDTPPVKDTKPDLETPIMKRDRELQRLLLLEVRDGQKPPELSKYSEADKVYNAALLINSGLVDGEAVQGGSGEYVSTVMTQLTSAGHDFLEKDTPSTEGSLESAFPTELAESLKKFRKDYPDRRKCAFIMMRFGATKAHTDIVESIRNALSAHGINALRADDKDYHDDLFWNILTYIYSCSFGIAVFERIEQEEFNPNVSLEVGYMMALRKPVLLLKDRTLRNLNTDLMGKLYKTFDPQSISGSVKPQLLRWMKDKNIIA